MLNSGDTGHHETYTFKKNVFIGLENSKGVDYQGRQKLALEVESLQRDCATQEAIEKNSHLKQVR